MNATQLKTSLLVSCVGVLVSLSTTQAGEWMTYRSTYTHDAYGQRVDQHTQPVEPLSPDQGNLVRSGYRHYRSTIQGSTSADNLHVTYEWGRPVMPYEHWRFPFRPYGVPYDQWGPPVPNVLSNFNLQNTWPAAPAAPPVGMPPGGMPPVNPGPGVPPNVPGHHPGGHWGHYPGGYPGTYPGGYPGWNPGWNAGGYPGWNAGGYPGALPGGYPTYPPMNAPWINGLYPSAPLR